MTDEPDLDDLLDGATPGFEDVHILLDGARRDEWNHLVQAALAQEPEPSPDASFGARSPRARAEEQLVALKEELRSKVLTIRVIQMPGTEWAKLKAEYRPREKNIRDERQGYNIEAVTRMSLLNYGKRVKGSADDVKLEAISAGQWAKIFDKAGGGDLQTLEYAVIGVNQLIGQQFVGALVKGSPATSNSAGK